jgi:hypothetical protein
MLLDYVIGNIDEGLIGAISAFDLRFTANLSYPFVGACRRIPGGSLLRVFPAKGKDVRASGEEAAEERDFFLRA